MYQVLSLYFWGGVVLKEFFIFAMPLQWPLCYPGSSIQRWVTVAKWNSHLWINSALLGVAARICSATERGIGQKERNAVVSWESPKETRQREGTVLRSPWKKLLMCNMYNVSGRQLRSLHYQPLTGIILWAICLNFIYSFCRNNWEDRQDCINCISYNGSNSNTQHIYSLLCVKHCSKHCAHFIYPMTEVLLLHVYSFLQNRKKDAKRR